ncbi:hypothetical protein A1F94_012590 [Pyrenophora tritici-repentis]|uniref:Uncharacterized protein n=3 Tax=Pyrenophora tritici-repentis TaxID=45151 RepID=A0A2W1I0I6_9PLEO|nr:uncharacterized protein PTRG_09560 [Pyrenophora tritici-repentis Pt-1C-BFP]KAF7443320.1 hypothetical protein A1F99_128270 [Pyrenophora tritici-repentis]EDU42611.1 conserved hypothetical protein [Pyrenophora tritici-repentis Pt-1C-BFP]KAG9376990.1 hypothetical protein A1F94_012590 [Pyrenophora tritici-repentis]KAI0610735.1 hypothetical protein TUN205_05018 [Pyrenophora tritici-repentis]KAI1512031.1 hypothetical protein Ptr86124_008871 [Pyrenophora tritici-repentis]
MNLLSTQLDGDDPSHDSQAPLLLGVCGSLTCLAVLIFGARLWSRLRPTLKLHLEDWTAGAATILAVSMYIIVCLACEYGFGQRSIHVSAASRSAAMRLIFICQLVWNFAINLVKISVALLLFRLKESRAWRIFLASTIVLLILTATTSTFFQFLQCRPFSVYWDPSVLSKGKVECISHEAITGNIVATSAIHISTDLIFSFIPITFISRLNRPLAEKIFLTAMMALGLFASTFAILRIAAANLIYTSPDVFRTTVGPTLWSMLELEIGLLAATIPTLKNFMQRSLVRLGHFFYEEQTEEQVRNRLVQLGYLRSEEEECDGTSLKSSKLDFDAESIGPKTLKKEQDEYVVTVKELSAADQEAKAMKRMREFVFT